MTFGKQRMPLKCGSPSQTVYSGRFTGINGAAPTTYKVDPGVTITRSGEGVYVITLPKPVANFKSVIVQATDNDGNLHDVAYALNATNRTITVTHRTSAYSAVGVDHATCTITDISTASSAYTVAPCAGTVTKVIGRLGGPITVANAVITTAINGTPITNGGFTVAFTGSALNDIDMGTPTAANTVAQGDLLTATTDGGSTDAQTEQVTFVITPAGPVVEDVIDEISFIAVVEESDVPGAGV